MSKPIRSHLTIEALDHLNIEDQWMVRSFFGVQGDSKMDLNAWDADLSRWASARGWFVYRGGSHLALHRRSGCPNRVIFITEAGRER